jgi:hypothetical protein
VKTGPSPFVSRLTFCCGTEVHDVVAETALVLQFETEADIVRQGLLAASHHDGRDEQVTLVDEPGSERVSSELRAAHGEVTFRGRFRLSYRASVELPLDPRAGARHRLQGLGVHDLVGRPPDLREVPPGTCTTPSRLMNSFTITLTISGLSVARSFPRFRRRIAARVIGPPGKRGDRPVRSRVPVGLGQSSRLVRSSWRSRSGSARMSISTILPPLTVTPPMENGCPSRIETTPTAPLISTGCISNSSRA